MPICARISRSGPRSFDFPGRRHSEAPALNDPVTLRVNGVERVIQSSPQTALLDVLRGELGLTGTRFGCGQNQCGACNVLIDGQAVASCDTPLWAAVGKEIT